MHLNYDLLSPLLKKVAHDIVGLDDADEGRLGDLVAQGRFQILQELRHLVLQILRRVRIVDVLADLVLQRTAQLQVDHSSVCEIDLGGKLGRLATELVHVGTHVTDNDSVDDRADGLQEEGETELGGRRSWDDLAHSENVEGRIQHHEVLPIKGCIAFEVALVRIFLAVIDEVHVLDPALRLEHKREPDSTEDVHNNEQLEGHHENFELNFRALGQVRATDGG